MFPGGMEVGREEIEALEESVGRQRRLVAEIGRGSGVAPLVARPLADTLPAQITASRQQQIDQFMDPVTFSYTYQQLFDGSYHMVLSPPHQ